MLENYLLRNLKPEEKVVTIVRRFFWAFIWWYMLSAVLIILAFFLLFPLVRLGMIGLIIFSLMLVAGIFCAVRQCIIWSMNIFLITNQRVVVFAQRGIFHKNVSSATFDNIKDISYNKKGVWPTVLNYGDIIVKTASLDSKIEFKKIKNPAKIQEKIADIQATFLENKA